MIWRGMTQSDNNTFVLAVYRIAGIFSREKHFAEIHKFFQLDENIVREKVAIGVML